MELNRRQWLALLGSTTAASLLTAVPAALSARESMVPLLRAAGMPADPSGPSCVVRPKQTEGPYFMDERLDRSDIRTDPSDGSRRDGTPLHVVLRLFRMGRDGCRPLRDAMVDVWQCDAWGVYSDVKDFNGLFDTRGKRFLRGYQMTDATGAARFTTIYPGWYEGRTVHIHFKIRTDPESRQGHEFTSQLYFEEAITDAVHRQPPYAAKGRRDTMNSMDGIFRRGGRELILPVIKDATGYTGIFDIGLQIA